MHFNIILTSASTAPQVITSVQVFLPKIVHTFLNTHACCMCRPSHFPLSIVSVKSILCEVSHCVIISVLCLRSKQSPLPPSQNLSALFCLFETKFDTLIKQKEALYILYIHPWTVSNTDNVNILCKYFMYILTDYRLILTKDTKDKPDLSSERADPSGTALATTSSSSKVQTRSHVREGATKQ
jgi:hypothetical protein